MKLLSTPAQRLGAAVAALGLVVLAYGWWELGQRTSPIDCLQSLQKVRRGCTEVRAGSALLFCGIVLAPLLRWIWHGKSSRGR